MTYSVRTLLLAAVVFMASRAIPPTVGQGKGPAAGSGPQVSRYVCVHCTQTGQLSSQGLFLSRAAVNRHISHAKACRNAGMGYREMPIQVQVRAGDVMAGGGGAAGPAPSIRHQVPGNLAGNATYFI